MEQEGVCGNPKCNNPLANGFHRHHNDTDRSNNDRTNLVLLCPTCHFATFGDDNPLVAHKDVERDVLEKIGKMIEAGINKEISGSHMEKILDGCTRSLQISRREKDIDAQLEYPPASVRALTRMKQIETEQNIFHDGYMKGLERGLSLRGEGKVE
jgi:hypothetical protein